MSKYTIGIDLGGTTMTAGLVDENYKIIGKTTWATRLPRPAEDLEKALADLCRTVVKENKVDFTDVKYVGIGTPGSVNFTTGFVGFNTNFGYYDWNLGPDLEAMLGCKVYVENDANAAAWGEAIAGAAKGSKSSVMITLGTGVGGGIVDGGKVYKGFNNAAGELGHIVIRVDGRPCTCGRHGCWEAYSSATGLINMTKEKIEECKQAGRETVMTRLVAEKGKVNGRTAFDGKRLGDAAACEVVDEYIKYLASGIASMINIFQPEVLSIGGGISNEGQYLLDLVIPKVHEQQYGTGLVPMTDIRIAQLRNDAGIIGAAVLGM